MNNNTKWVIGLVVAGVVILGGSLIAYGVTKYDKDHPGSSSGSSSTVSSTGSKTTTPGSTSATPVTSSQTSSSCSPVSQAASLEGTSGCIQFVGYADTSPSSGSMYLDQSLSPPYGFSVYIPASYASLGQSLLSQYSGQNIDVTGSIINYKGEPEIEVTSASQITLAN